GPVGGLVAVAEADVLIGNAVTFNPTEGASFTGAVATFTNTGYPANTAADFSATIDWGDGTTTTGAVSGGSGADLTVTGTHTYAEDGSFNMAVTLTDDAPGTATATANSTANVQEFSLTITGNPISATEGTSFSGTVAIAQDPGSTDPASQYSATIDWGDGTTTAGTVIGAATGNLVANSGFETGDFTGWTQSGNTGFTGVDSGNVHSGSFAAFFGPIGSLGFITQNIPTVAGAQYTFSWFLQNNGGTPNEFQAYWDGTQIVDQINFAGQGYTLYSFTE